MYLEINGTKLSTLSAHNFSRLPFFFHVPSQELRYFLETSRFYILRGTIHTHEFAKSFLEQYDYSPGNLHAVDLSVTEDSSIIQNVEGYLYFFFDVERGYHTIALRKTEVIIQQESQAIARMRRHPLFEQKHFVHKVDFLSPVSPTKFL